MIDDRLIYEVAESINCRKYAWLVSSLANVRHDQYQDAIGAALLVLKVCGCRVADCVTWLFSSADVDIAVATQLACSDL